MSSLSTSHSEQVSDPMKQNVYINNEAEIVSWKQIQEQVISLANSSGLEWEKAQTVKTADSLRDEVKQLWNKIDDASHKTADLAIQPYLQYFEQFFRQCSAFESKMETSVVWIVIYRLLEIASKRHGAMYLVQHMLKDLARPLQNFNTFPEEKFSGASTMMKQCLIDIAVETLQLLIKAIEWLDIQPEQQQYDTLNLDAALAQGKGKVRNIIENLIRYFTLQKFASTMTDTQRVDIARSAKLLETTSKRTQLPCYSTLPSVKNLKFFGRSNILEQIDECIGTKVSKSSLQSLAIYGLGGVGKTQIALEYAHAQAEKKGFKAVLWANSETRDSLLNDFSEFAKALGLPDTQTSSEDRVNVLDWLQRTSEPWLLIFDNAEEPKLLVPEFWPASRHGSILITSRNHAMGFYPALSGLEILTFDEESDEESGGQFILHLLGSNLQSPATDDEKLAARELSRKLQGHALAINQMSALMIHLQTSIRRFISLYDKKTQKIHREEREDGKDPRYSHFLGTVWKLSFDTIKHPNHSAAFEVLAVLSWIAPESIPEALFVRDDIEDVQEDSDVAIDDDNNDIPEVLKNCCTDEFDFSKAIEILLKLALVKRTVSSSGVKILSLHRLVQTEFSYYMLQTDLQRAFRSASLLLSNVFPKQVHVAPMHNMWDHCKLYSQHAVTLAEKYNKYSRDQKMQVEPSIEFCRLLSNVAWFLKEYGSSEVQSVSQIGIKAHDACPSDKQDILVQNHLNNTAAASYLENGFFDKAEPLFRECLRIRKDKLGNDHPEVGAAYNNLGLNTSSQGKHEEALGYYTESTRIDQLNIDEDPTQVPWGWMNLGRGLLLVGRWEEAETFFGKALVAFKEANNWYLLTHILMAWANLNRKVSRLESQSVDDKKRRLDKAKAQYSEALNIILPKGKIQITTSTCYYKLGCIALEQNENEVAKQHFQDALAIAKLQSLCKPHLARISFNYAEALRRTEPGNEKIELYLSEAKSLRREIQGDRYDDSQQNEEAYDRAVPVMF